MEDFNGLASSLAAGVDDVRGCLIVSRDGLVLGAYPDDGEVLAKAAWLRFATLGDPERGFAQFGTETWCYVRRGPYSAFAVVGPGARPGLVIDHMEQVLLAAEETRNSREGVRPEPVTPTPAAVPSSKPRTPLHPDRPLEEPVVFATDHVAEPADRRAATPSVRSDDLPSAPEPPAPEGPEPSADGSSVTERGAAPRRSPSAFGSVWGDAAEEEGEDLDRRSITEELGRLLQEGGGGADR